MEIKIMGSAKEIADLVVALQGQHKISKPPEVKVNLSYDGKEISELNKIDGTTVYQVLQKATDDSV